MTVTTTTMGLATTFITFDATNIVVSWQTLTNAQIGTYIITITGTISAASIWSSTTQFKLTVQGSCIGSIETNSVVASTPPSSQTYSLRASQGNVTINEFTVDSTYCYQSDIKYSMTVAPQTTGQATAFITFDATNRIVSWSTNDATLVGLYTLTITGTITTTQIWSKTTSFTLLVYQCQNSPETITISSGSAPNDQSYKVGIASTSQIINQFSVVSSICTQSDIVYSMLVTPLNLGQSTNFITFDATNRIVAWQTYSNLQVGTYNIAITGIISALSTWTQTTSFKLTVGGSCLYSTETIQLAASTPKIDETYLLGSSTNSVTIDEFTVNSTYCFQSDIKYSMTVAPVTAGQATQFITFGTTNRIVAWSTNDATQVGFYTLTITGTITTTSTWSKTTSFTLLVYKCSNSPEIITIASGSAPNDQSYKVGSASSSQTIIQFTENSNACSSSDIIYSMFVTPLTMGVATTFIKFDATNRIVAWQTNSNVQVGTYTVTITGTISAASTWTFQTSFKLTVEGSCYYTTETDSLAAGIQPYAQHYTVGATKAIQNIQQFTESSVYCTQADIYYLMSVKPFQSNQTTSFITFSDRQVTWYTISNAQEGNYTITITGNINNTVLLWSRSVSFNLTVSGNCDYSTGYYIFAPVNSTNCTNSTQSTLTQYVGQPKTYLQVGNFSENDPQCTQANITLNSIFNPTTPGQSSSFINYDNSTNIVSFQTNNKLDVGVFTITVTASINGLVYKPQNYTKFTLIVERPDCSTTYEQINITAPSPPTRQVAYVTQPGGTLIQDFSENSEYCTSLDINYTMIVSSDIADQTVEFITFNPSNKLVQWSPTSILEIGNFTITIFAQLRSFNQTLSFQFEVKSMPPVNHPPVFSGLTNNSPSLSLSDFPENGILNFGPLTDPDPGDTVQLTYTINPSIGYTYFQIDTLTGVFSITDKSGLVASSVSIYIIKITLQDSNILQPARSSYIITFDIQNQKVEEISRSKSKQNSQISMDSSGYNVSYTEDTNALPPQWKTITISNAGQVKIQFSEKLLVPNNASVTINSSVLKVRLLSPEPDFLKYQKFQWNLTEFIPQQMTLQLFFENPLYISSLGKAKLDSIEVTCLNNSFFISAKSYRPLDTGQVLKKTVPPQLSGVKGTTSETLKSTLSDGSSGMVITTLITNLLLSGSLTQLWGMLNSLQIIDNLADLNTFVPANVKDFYSFIKNLSSFKVIPTDKIFEWIGLSDETEYNQFKSLGPLFLVLLLFVAILLTLGLLEVLMINFKYVRNLPKVNKIYIKMKNFLFWIATLRYIMESYSQLFLTSLTLAYSGFNWNSNLDRAQAIFSMFTLLICAVSPLAMTVYFCRRIKMFKQKHFLDRFSSVMGDLNWRNKLSSCFISIFCYRRMVLILIIVFFGAYPYAQVQLTVVSCMLVIIFFGYTNAYFLKGDRQQEFFNESTIMLCAYHYFLFTDFVESPEQRYSMGYSLIATTGLNIGVNFIILLLGSLLNFMKLYKTLQRQYRVKQQIRKLKNKHEEDQKFKLFILAQKDIIEIKKEDCLKARNDMKKQVLEVISEVVSEKEQSERGQKHRRARNQRALQSHLQSSESAIKMNKGTFEKNQSKTQLFQQRPDMSFAEEEKINEFEQVGKDVNRSIYDYDHEEFKIPSLFKPSQTSPPSQNETQLQPYTSNLLLGLTLPPEWKMSYEIEKQLDSQIASQMREYEQVRKTSQQM